MPVEGLLKGVISPQPLAQRVGRILIGPFRLPELGELVIGGVDLAGEVGIVKKQGFDDIVHFDTLLTCGLTTCQAFWRVHGSFC